MMMLHFQSFLGLGKFDSGNKRDDPIVTVPAKLGEPLVLTCPKHTKGVGNSYLWGNMPDDSRPPTFWQSGVSPIENAFYDSEGSFIFQSLSQKDVDNINGLVLGGVSCMLFRKEILSSNPIKLDVNGQG
jgi:hypothetical protein